MDNKENKLEDQIIHDIECYAFLHKRDEDRQITKLSRRTQIIDYLLSKGFSRRVIYKTLRQLGIYK